MSDAHTEPPSGTSPGPGSAPPTAAAPGAPPGAPHVPQHTVVIPTDVPMVALLGPRDELLRTMERQFPQTRIAVRGNEFQMSGPSAEVALVERLIDELLAVIDAGQPLNRDAVERSIGMLRAQTAERPADVLTLNIVSNRGRTIRPKTLGQKRYVDAIDTNTIVFGIGPAGTGKTYLAMAKAVAALQAKQVNRIILTRPAVEAGERLGFLPGTLNDKIDPYLRPLYDALHDMVDPESIPRLMAAGTIEVAPLAYMRGRAQPLDSRVLTPEGFRRFGDLRVGDLVVGSNGMPTPVLGVYPQGRKPVYRVTAQDGASTVCCGEHLWTVRTPEDRRRGRWRTVETRTMVGLERRAHARRFELPLVAPVEFPAATVPLDPYALGLLLGDGCITTATTPSFTTADPELALVAAASGSRGSAAGGSAAPWFHSLIGTDSGSRITDEYLANSVAVRLAVLQGLLDRVGEPLADGASAGTVRCHRVTAGLRADVVALVRSLGGVAVPVERDVVDIRLPAQCPPFRLARKRAAYERCGGGRPRRHIESIVPVGEAETMCIQVAAADSLYVTDDFLLTHNTLNDAFIILDEAQNTSPEQMKMFLTRLGFGSKMVVTGDVTQVDLPGATQSGLKVVRDILLGLEDVHFAELTAHDVVRHRLVGAIVDAYGRWDAAGPSAGPGGDGDGSVRRGGGPQGRGTGRGPREHRRAQRD
jgi:phosphate starvation-inducible PhoH-like protein